MGPGAAHPTSSLLEDNDEVDHESQGLVPCSPRRRGKQVNSGGKERRSRRGFGSSIAAMATNQDSAAPLGYGSWPIGAMVILWLLGGLN